MDKHQPYEQQWHRKCDFIVRYTFFTPEEGGRRNGLPAQGYRSDFKYEEDLYESNVYIIHPEFLDSNGQVIEEPVSKVLKNGKATMWILNDEYFAYHQKRLKVGTKGFLVEAGRKVASCEVIELVRLSEVIVA